MQDHGPDDRSISRSPEREQGGSPSPISADEAPPPPSTDAPDTPSPPVGAHEGRKRKALRAEPWMLLLGPARSLVRIGWRVLVGPSPTLRSGLLRVAVVGLLIRLLLLPYTGEADLSAFAADSQSMLYGGGPYSYLLVYPPAWEYYLGGVGWTTGALGTTHLLVTNPQLLIYNGRFGYAQPAYFPVPIYATLEKLPLVAADLLAGGLLCEIVRQQTQDVQKALATFAMWFLNPLVIVDSSIHGAFDVLPVVLSLASLFLLDRRRYATAGIALGLGASLKVFPVFFAPLVLVVMYRQSASRLREMGRPLVLFFGGALLTGAVFFLPPGVLSDYLLYSTTGPTAGQSFWGFGIWSWLSVPVLNAPGRWLSDHTVGVLAATTVLGVVALLLAARWMLKGRETRALDPAGLSVGFTAIYAAWMANAIVHPQYVEWILPFLLLQTILLGRFRWTFWAASGLATLFYLFSLGNPLLFFEPLGLFTHVAPLAYFLSPYPTFEPLIPWFSILASVPVSALLIVAFLRQLQDLRLGARPT